MATRSDTPATVQPAHLIPDCGYGDEEYVGSIPVPWVPRKHCFKFYEFRYATAPIGHDDPATVNAGRSGTRVRYEHAFDLLGRKQGPVVHSLTLLPKEQIRIDDTGRSIFVSTVDENESVHSTARVLRNDNECHAVTYFIRRVLEVYQLTTRVVGIEVQLGDAWVDVNAAERPIEDEVKQLLGHIDVGSKQDPKMEIVLPTDVWVYDAALAH